MEAKYPVLDFFKVNTPSLCVTIRADDTPIPRDIQIQPNQANLVTVSSAESKEGAPAEDSPKASLSPRTTSQPLKRALSVAETHIVHTQHARAVDMLRRSESKHAAEIYGQPGAPQPVQGLDDDTDTQETRDFTYWDRLHRRGTETHIRRWHTYMPQQEEDSAFFGRNILVDIPAEAYIQGVYYSELDSVLKKNEYALSTGSYVGPPIWVRGVEMRGFRNPMFDMEKRIHTECSCCP